MIDQRRSTPYEGIPALDERRVSLGDIASMLNRVQELGIETAKASETLGIETIAEGIESESQAAALLALGCVAGQGFLFAKADSLEYLSTTPFVTRHQLSA